MTTGPGGIRNHFLLQSLYASLFQQTCLVDDKEYACNCEVSCRKLMENFVAQNWIDYQTFGKGINTKYILVRGDTGRNVIPIEESGTGIRDSCWLRDTI